MWRVKDTLKKSFSGLKAKILLSFFAQGQQLLLREESFVFSLSLSRHSSSSAAVRKTLDVECIYSAEEQNEKEGLERQENRKKEEGPEKKRREKKTGSSSPDEPSLASTNVGLKNSLLKMKKGRGAEEEEEDTSPLPLSPHCEERKETAGSEQRQK